MTRKTVKYKIVHLLLVIPKELIDDFVTCSYNKLETTPILNLVSLTLSSPLILDKIQTRVFSISCTKFI